VIKKPLHTSKQLILTILLAVIVLIAIVFYQGLKPQVTQTAKSSRSSSQIVSGEFNRSSFKTDEQWRNILTPEQYHILREAGTEVPFTGELNDEKRKGTYYSVGCDKPLFRSEQKYDSGTGWPSFWAPIAENALILRKEGAPGDDRTEVLDTCGGHLGHVFDDGPTTLPNGKQATGKRYCMNSIALRFVPDNN
jgi:methionine-R-sulfoxide reductase